MAGLSVGMPSFCSSMLLWYLFSITSSTPFHGVTSRGNGMDGRVGDSNINLNNTLHSRLKITII